MKAQTISRYFFALTTICSSAYAMERVAVEQPAVSSAQDSRTVLDYPEEPKAASPAEDSRAAYYEKIRSGKIALPQYDSYGIKETEEEPHRQEAIERQPSDPKQEEKQRAYDAQLSVNREQNASPSQPEELNVGLQALLSQAKREGASASLTQTLPLLQQAAEVSKTDTKKAREIIGALIVKLNDTLTDVHTTTLAQTDNDEEIRDTKEKLEKLMAQKPVIDAAAEGAEAKHKKVKAAIHKVAEKNPNAISPETLNKHFPKEDEPEQPKSGWWCVVS